MQHDTPNPSPTVGRIVHYQHRDVTLAAVVTGFPNDPSARAAGMVTLCAWQPHGADLHVDAFYSATPKNNYWSWPPRV